ncbi:MAG TPA: fasciclin domain-containing protein [Sphingomonas sp.]|nr:fasciclin domain-containing protein [Sphingomonas sp.]
MIKPLLLALTSTMALAACTTMDNGDSAAASPAGSTAPVADAGTANTASASGNPTVGGAAMSSSMTIVQNASAAPNLTTLVAAVKAAGLVETLSGPGPFTVFAPTNDAFGRLAPGTVDSLLKPENKASLVKVLTYHVVAGTVSAAQLMDQIKAGNGTATLTTVAGQPLTATMTGNVVTLTSATGNKSYVEVADVRQSNGIVHVVNGVLVPTLG